MQNMNRTFMFRLLFLSSFYLMLANSSSSSSSSFSSSMHQPQQPLMCHDSESSALLQFKQSFLIDEECASYDPSAYPKVATWNSSHDHDCCSWDGVECDRETGHVIGLHLASSCLYGSINSSITLFNLHHLRTLDLSYNHFNYSQIPSAVAQLSKLRSLNLSHSVFSGQIPWELLALSKLVFLDLYGDTDPSGNPLLKLHKPGLREVVGSLTHLKTLHLSHVDISSTIPHELGNLSSLTSLDLRGCGLHGQFPTGIFQLPNLQYLYVFDNPDLNGYLPEFEERNPLQTLFLGNTGFSGELPTSIGRLSSLTELDLRSCNFTGKIPPSLANLTALTWLVLFDNNFSVGTLSWLGQQTKLTVLDLDRMNLRGEIPSSLVNMTQLTFLSLSGNQLSGQIPSWLMNLTQLTELCLGENNLEGSIPSSLFELVNLNTLILNSNYFNGTLETHLLSKLKYLTLFEISDNSLSCLSYNNSTNLTFPKFKILALSHCNLTEFPDFLQNQDELKFISLSGNYIQGLIPTWIWNISRDTLEALHLDRNFLTGFDQLPAVLPWSRLTKLELHSNMLHGPLPIPPPSTIQYSASQNNLTGPIPPLICSMTSLLTLDLSSNSLSGRIPPCLANFSRHLLVLNLGSNNFSGPVPETCTGPNTLEVIDLGENQFEGRLPRSLGSCVLLQHLGLGNNQINDSFPFWLGALPQLQVLILRANRFHGEIGSWHTDFRFRNLHIIDLSDNEFIGELPSEYFQNWDSMKLTNVSDSLQYMQLNFTFEVPGFVSEFPYFISMTIANKGLKRLFYNKILTTLMAIDLSGNKFRGQIPACIGRLQGLHVLNLGRNDLTGPISPSLGNLTQLESLDLSQNKLSGGIPWQLTSLTFLEFCNVSHNNLTGPIPQGQQLTAFPNDSFVGNPGLCGLPLSRECEGPPPSKPNASSSEQEGPTIFSSELGWTFVFMGYASGLVIGVSIGYCFTTWKHEWFVKTFGKPQRYISKWVRTERMG